MIPFDQYTRWLCPKCGAPGIDSFNKAIFDGPPFEDAFQFDEYIFGDQCQRCTWAITVRYTTADEAPTAIVNPEWEDREGYNYQRDAIIRIATDPDLTLQPSDQRDRDWSRGCLAARGQLQ